MSIEPETSAPSPPTATAGALVILNPVAGSATPDKIRTVLEQTLARQGQRITIHETEPDESPTAIAELARRTDSSLVVAAGGDGTVSLAAHAIIGTDLTLGILPVGTANVLARELGVPADLEGAARLLVEGNQVRRLDVMQVGDRHFVLQIGIGLDSLMIRDTDRAEKRRVGRLAYVKTLLSKVVGFNSRRFTIQVDGRRRRLRAWQVLVANAGTLGVPPFTWGPDIHPDDGQLDLCVYNVQTPTDYVRLVWQLLTGRHRHGPGARFYRIRERAIIVADRALPVQADGEIIGDTPVTVRVVPHALRVLTPAEPEPVSPITLAAEADKA